MKDSGYCRVCCLHFAIPDSFHSGKEFGICPKCNGILTLNHQSVESLKDKLRMNNISDKIAYIKPQ